MTHLRGLSGILALLGAVILLTTSATAQSGDPITVVVGKTTLLRLDERPEVIFIGNPAYVDIILEQNDIAFLIGRQTGETSMHLLDGDGETTMHVPIVVVPEERRHVTLTRGRAETTFSCNPRCAGVPNPHAAGASIARGQESISGAGDAEGQGQDSAAAGRIRVGGEFQGGKDLAADELPNSLRLAATDATRITADATGAAGDGGRIILWGDERAAVLGTISARPGSLAGAGGFVEISSAGELVYRAEVATGRGDRHGTVLLDPKNFTAAAAAAAAAVQPPAPAEDTGPSRPPWAPMNLARISQTRNCIGAENLE